MDSWIKLYRKSVESRVFARPELWKLWCLCLILANHTDKWVEIDRVLAPILVKRGQFITGRFQLHAAYYRKKHKTNKSPRTVWRWLRELEKWQNLTLKTSKRFSIVSICNYSTYQDIPDDNVQANVQQVSNKCPTSVQQVSTNKNDKNVKNDKKRKKPFAPPSLEEVAAYCRERKNSVDPQQWHDHYLSNGWRVGKNAMKDWKAAVRKWERNEFQPPQQPISSPVPPYVN